MSMPLTMVHEGHEVILCEILGGMGIRRRLTDMGLRPGSRIRIVSNSRGGPFVIGIGDMCLMLGHGMAQKIMVRDI